MGHVKGKTGTVRSVVFTPALEERKDLLLAESGMNFNALIRLFIEKLTPSDIEQLKRR